MRVLLFLSNNLSTRLLVYLLTKETTRQLVNLSTRQLNLQIPLTPISVSASGR